MVLRKWEELPENMRNEKVKAYYAVLQKKKTNLVFKMVFDRIVSAFMILGLLPIFLIISIMIKADSKGDVFFRQERVTQYGKRFKIYKFRTMVQNAENIGSQVTTKNDMRVTNVGKKLRGCRLDELPQLINILKGEMSFVGTRPEVLKYVEHYSDEMMATLLLPAGVTSKASIEYKDEEKLLNESANADEIYINTILPEKMKWNLEEILKFNFAEDVKTMIKTVHAVS